MFGIFQGWLINNDRKQCGQSLEEEKFLRNMAKFTPFFGWPSYPLLKDGFDYEGFSQTRSDSRRRREIVERLLFAWLRFKLMIVKTMKPAICCEHIM
mmetsp:Transcript_15775/g.28622  ORF Transcript_15775/g.28622 Transcript_15775/m.28622 type:complete len:97 (+) Transcript_15775:277-567(+)